MTASAPSPPLLDVQGLSKAFPGVQALDNVDLTLNSSEVLALLGENGAGKSTLIKILGGAQAADTGVISINGQTVSFRHPVDSRKQGIGIIYQEFNLVPEMTVVENLFLGQESTRAGFIRRPHEAQAVRRVFERLGIDIDPSRRISTLSVAEQQLVEIARAFLSDSRILIMDEPTAALSTREVDVLFRVVKELRQSGIGIIYISHRLDEIFALADRVTVLRDGKLVGTKPLAKVDRPKLIEMMVGRSLEQEFPTRQPKVGAVRLEVRHLSQQDVIDDVSFDVRGGEILALAGLVGAGRTELVRLIFGADRPDRGTIRLDGRTLTIRRPRDAIQAGICLLTEDRKQQGLVLLRSCLENFSLANLERFSRFGWINQKREQSRLAEYQAQLSLRIPSISTPSAHLSGGNQQKLLLARWLERNAEVLIFDEPTRGIDVGAKLEIYKLMARLAAQGKAIVMVSSELPEVLGMADRILVMRDGAIAGEITDVDRTTQEEVMALAVGETHADPAMT